MTSLALEERLRSRRDLPPPAMRRAIRQAAGLSLDDLAEELGVSRQAVGHWECGDRYPRPAALIAYCDLLRKLQELQ